MSAGVEKQLDEIYGGPPADFVAGRDAIAKRLRADGKSDEADRVKSLRKPSKAASAVNALALAEPKKVKRYIGLADALRKATSGKVDASKMRSLAREDGELLEELVARAAELTDGIGTASRDRVRETLQAAQIDPEVGERVSAGRVEREERAASVGLENLLASPKAPPRRSKSKPAKRAESRRDAKVREAKRDLARAEAELAKAERARATAERKVKAARSKLERLT